MEDMQVIPPRTVMRFVGPDPAPLFAALAAAQGEFGVLTKTHTAKVKSATADYEYKYADLADVIAAVRPALTAQGLCLVQIPDVDQGEKYTWIGLTTILAHGPTGARLETLLQMSCEGSTPQKIGSGITYARRYALSALLGLAPDSDDDGRVASERERPERPAPAQQTRQQQPNRNDRRSPPPPKDEPPPPKEAAPSPELEKARRYLRKHKIDFAGMANDAVIQLGRQHYLGVAREWLELRGVDTREMADEVITAQYQAALAAEKAGQPADNPPQSTAQNGEAA